jgi:hypothetical protein
MIFSFAQSLGVTIMESRSSLIKIIPDLHLNQEFYYRSLATVKGKKAELSEAYAISVC